MPIEVPDSSTEADAVGDVANKSLGTDMPMSMADEAAAAAADSLLLWIDCDRDGMGMGIDALVFEIWVEEEFDDVDVEEEEVLLLLLLLLLDSVSCVIDIICSPMLLNWFVGISLFKFWDWIEDEMTDDDELLLIRPAFKLTKKF